MNEKYSGLCGITEEEIETFLGEELTDFAERRQMTTQECREVLRKQYDGYHFHPNSPGYIIHIAY